jgi:hypothetical protein
VVLFRVWGKGSELIPLYTLVHRVTTQVLGVTVERNRNGLVSALGLGLCLFVYGVPLTLIKLRALVLGLCS